MISSKIVLTATALTAVFLFLLSGVARSHEWYPFECCSDRDCGPHPTADVQEKPEGFTLKSTNEFIPRKSIRFSPDGQYHICRNQYTQQILCFFVPNTGS